MKFLAAIKKYMALSSAQKQFIKAKKRKFQMSTRDIINFLDPMASFDSECDQAISQLFKFNLVFFLLLISSLFIAGANESLAGLLAISSVVLLAGGLFIRIILGRINIHDSLRELVLPLISTLGEDADPEKQMQLSLDLSGKMVPAKLTSQTKNDAGWFSYPKVTTSIYDDNWLDLQIALIDGTQIKLSIHDKITSRYKTYKAISGKIKSKTKNKCKQLIQATVSLRNKAYAEANTGQLQKMCDRFKTKDGQNRRAITMTKVLSFYGSDQHPQPSICIDLIGKVFMNISPAARKGA